MKSPKILVVEDESIALDIQKILLRSGYSVVEIATSATTAFAKLEAVAIDLVLIDIQLQGEMDGIEAAKIIQLRWQLPIVYLTNHTDELTLQRLKITQPIGYLIKPFKERELVTTLEVTFYRYQVSIATQKALEQERELSELKSRFVAIVSHEFRNPLSAIKFSSKLLEEYDSQLSEEKRNTYCQKIKTSVQRMTDLLNDVLTIEDVETGKLKFHPTLVDLKQFCQDLIEEVRLGASESPRIICFDYSFQYRTLESDSQSYWLDTRLLHYILSNLLSNAIKYSPEGGDIHFKVSCTYDFCRFYIRDQGIGIPLADQAQLFLPFHRATNVKKIQGTGLGLSIVKQCVDLHGGYISVDSEVNVGTTFIVQLPIAQLNSSEAV